VCAVYSSSLPTCGVNPSLTIPQSMVAAAYSSCTSSANVGHRHCTSRLRLCMLHHPACVTRTSSQAPHWQPEAHWPLQARAAAGFQASEQVAGAVQKHVLIVWSNVDP
jgi:hypothetical protein